MTTLSLFLSLFLVVLPDGCTAAISGLYQASTALIQGLHPETHPISQPVCQSALMLQVSSKDTHSTCLMQ